MQNDFAAGLVELLAKKDHFARLEEENKNLNRKKALAAKVHLLTGKTITAAAAAAAAELDNETPDSSE